MHRRYLTALTALLLSASLHPGPAVAEGETAVKPPTEVSAEPVKETVPADKASAKQENLPGSAASSQKPTDQASAKQIDPAAARSTSENAHAARPHVTLALGGGGTKCVTEIGVLRVLLANHIPIDYIVGTSSGATIGSLYCAGVPLNDIEKMYHDGTIQKAMVPNMVPRMLLKPLEKLASPLKGDKPAAGLTDGATFRDFLAKRLPASFNGFKIPFAAVVTNLSDGQTYMLKEGNPAQAVLASNAFPGLFRPVTINGKLYVDGGVKANMPANCAKATGADFVIAVMSDETVSKQPNEKFTSIKSVMGRVTDIMHH